MPPLLPLLLLAAVLGLARRGRAKRPGKPIAPGRPLRLATFNAPRWSPKKLWVGSVALQTLRLRRLANRLDVDIAGILESYPAQRARLKVSRRWGVWASTPNPGGPGQAVMHRRSPRALRVRRRRARTVSTPFARYAGSGGLHMALATFSRAGVELPVAVVHLPRTQDDPKNQWDDQLDAVAAALPDSGPAAVLIDGNRRPSDVAKKLGPGWKVAASADVIAVLVRDCEVGAAGIYSRSYRWFVSDHTAAPYADITPRPSTTTQQPHRGRKKDR